jgi:hypothetical protein
LHLGCPWSRLGSELGETANWSSSKFSLENYFNQGIPTIRLALQIYPLRRKECLVVTTFDIFRGKASGDCFWVGTSDDLSGAIELMNRTAEKTPGDYFVFCYATNEVVAVIDADKPRVKMSKSAAAG